MQALPALKGKGKGWALKPRNFTTLSDAERWIFLAGTQRKVKDFFCRGDVCLPSFHRKNARFLKPVLARCKLEGAQPCSASGSGRGLPSLAGAPWRGQWCPVPALCPVGHHRWVSSCPARRLSIPLVSPCPVSDKPFEGGTCSGEDS